MLRECPIDHRCMTRVTVDRVLAEARGLLAERVTARGPPIFIDRDGTLSHEVGYVNHLRASGSSRTRWTPSAWSTAAGFLAVLVTNQAGVARGYFPESLIHEVHASLRARMEAGGARLDGIYYCPHHPTVGEPPYRQDCDCRKPRPGLLQRAAARARHRPRALVRGRRPPRRPGAGLGVGAARRAGEDAATAWASSRTTPRAGRASRTSWPSTCWRRCERILAAAEGGAAA